MTTVTDRALLDTDVLLAATDQSRREHQAASAASSEWPTIVDAVKCGGRQVHDANVVATMLVHGVQTVVTSNAADFTRFGAYVRVSALRP